MPSMRVVPRAPWLPLALALSACHAGSPEAAERTTAAAAASGTLAGWYDQGRFQPCGEPAVELADAAELDRRIHAQGMSADDPVYVRIQARREGSRLLLAQVLQVGSPTPIRDCPMTGTRTP